MSWIPAFEIGWINGWLFMIIFPLQWLAVIIVPKRISGRTSHPADLKQSPRDRLIGRINEIFWIGATLYSIFVPLHAGTVWFYTGLGLFIAGLIILVLATLAVSRAPLNKPFTGGIYKFSRHPMYLSLLFVYLGVSIAAVSWLFFLITVITFFLQSNQAMQEEKYCLAKFGDDYRDYKNSTPRWIGMPGHKNAA